jgi:ABC-2 type transport system permease protein
MRKLGFIIRKEFIQIFRNKAILPILTVVPIVQLIVLTFAATNEVREVHLTVVDHDRTEYSRRLIGKIGSSDRFVLDGLNGSVAVAKSLMHYGKIDIILVIPDGFEHDAIQYEPTQVQLLVNAINGQQALVGASYLNAIIQGFNVEVALDVVPLNPDNVQHAGIGADHMYWYNPSLDYKYFMVPGIMGELVTILVMVLTAMNIVREREIGTIEQINVTPIRKWQFILGKMIPFLIIGLVLLTVGLTVGKLLFDVPMHGKLIIVFAYCVVNLMAVLGLGLFISNLSNTQQQAMFTTFFFIIIFILMSGLFTPIESMPQWAQYLTIPNPIAHFVNVMRAVLLKGSTFSDVAFNFQVTAVLAVVFNILAVVSYRKVA